ncbi:MAG: hypothetical protein HY688_05060, partial [Chloroflexi bacterium]|nr:hypothetical protein [Chloroflexota bacterium]
MRLPPLKPAVLLRRLNRFVVLLRTEEGQVMAHLPNSGRLE